MPIRVGRYYTMSSKCPPARLPPAAWHEARGSGEQRSEGEERPPPPDQRQNRTENTRRGFPVALRYMRYGTKKQYSIVARVSSYSSILWSMQAPLTS